MFQGIRQCKLADLCFFRPFKPDADQPAALRDDLPAAVFLVPDALAGCGGQRRIVRGLLFRAIPDRPVALGEHLADRHKCLRAVRELHEHPLAALRQNAPFAACLMEIPLSAGIFRDERGKIVRIRPRLRRERLNLAYKLGRSLRVIEQVQLFLRPRHGDVEQPPVLFIFPPGLLVRVLPIRPCGKNAVLYVEQIDPVVFQPLAGMDGREYQRRARRILVRPDGLPQHL